MPVPVDLSKLSDVVKYDAVNKNVFDKLVAKVNGIDTSVFVLKTKYDTDKRKLENKIPDTSDLVKKTDYDAKITEMEGKIPSVNVLATNAALTTVENKIPNISIERMYSINFTVTRKKFCLSLHYNSENSYFLLMVLKSLNSKQKILRLLKLQYV